MNTVVFFIQKSSVLLWHKDGQSCWCNFIFNILNHCKPSELFNMLHSTRMAHALPRLCDCHTLKWIQVVDKRFLLQCPGNADQLPLELKNKPGVLFTYCYFLLFFSILLLLGTEILPWVEFTAIVSFQAFAAMKGFSCFFSCCCCCFLWNMICKLKALLEDCTFNSTNSIWKIRASNCTCKQMTNTGTITVQAKWAGHLYVEASVINSLLKAQKCKPKRHSYMNET